MDEIQVDHIRNLDRFLMPLCNLRAVPGFYQDMSVEDIEDMVEDHYESEPIYVHSFNEGNDNDIPAQYAYLRNNIEHFRGSVNLAKSYANVALDKVTTTFMNNQQNRFEINHEYPLVKYIEKVFLTTDNNILTNIAIRLSEALNYIKIYFDENHDIYFATAKNNPGYRVPADCPAGFSPTADKDKRIVIMVDMFEETDDIMESPESTVSETVLHEASHHAIGTVDFIVSPTRVTAGNALDFMEVMDEALSPTPARVAKADRESIELDLDFFNTYKKHLDINTITPAQFLKKLQVDPMLKANVIIDNADFLARMIYDIFANETFPETPLRELIRYRGNVGVDN